MTDAPTTVRALRKFLVERYPATFCGRAVEKRALALTIRRDLIEAHPEIDAELIVKTLKDYCGGPTYLASILEGAPRINLSGETQGMVSRQSEFHARARLREMAKHQKHVAFHMKDLAHG